LGLDQDAVFVDSLDGSEPVRMSEGREVAWLPYNEAVTLPSTTPSPLAEAEGVDIGLDQRLCSAEWLGSIDFRGDGVGGSAWTGVFVKDDGTCPMNSDEGTIVAADWTGDKVADDWWGPFRYCNYCVPFERTDLNADGRQELVIQHLFSIVDYNFFAVVESHGSLELQPLRVAEPGHPQARLEPGTMLTVTAGGDEGYGSYLHCEGYPDNITLVWAWLFSAVESGDPVEVHESRIALGDDMLFHVVEARDFTVAQSIDAGVDTYTGASCGVRWDIWAASPT
jgi:hypothetical protein